MKPSQEGSQVLFTTAREKGTEGDSAGFVRFFHFSVLGAALLPTG